MSRCTLRSIFIVLLYAGVAVFLFPHFIGRLTHVGFYAFVGLGIAAICGALYCCCIEGDCKEPIPAKPTPRTLIPR